MGVMVWGGEGYRPRAAHTFESVKKTGLGCPGINAELQRGGAIEQCMDSAELFRITCRHNTISIRTAI